METDESWAAKLVPTPHWTCEWCGKNIADHYCDGPGESERKLTIRLDSHIRQNAFFRLALLDIHQREVAQDTTTCWVRSKYEPIMTLISWVGKVLDEANAMEDDGDERHK